MAINSSLITALTLSQPMMDSHFAILSLIKTSTMRLTERKIKMGQMTMKAGIVALRANYRSRHSPDAPRADAQLLRRFNACYWHADDIDGR